MGPDTEAIWVGCNHRHLTCIAAVEHLDKGSVPVLDKAMVAVQLHLVCLVFVMALNHLPCVENVFCVFMPNVLHDDCWCIRFLLNFYDILIDVIKQLVIPLLP